MLEQCHAAFRAEVQRLRPALSAPQVVADTLAWLGPCIGPQAFEVGDEVREAFVAWRPEAGASSWTSSARACIRASSAGRAPSPRHALWRLTVPQTALAGIESGDPQLGIEKDIDAPGQAARDADALVLRAAYLKPQLLGQLNPARFRAAEIRQIAAFLERYADRAQLGKAEGLLCIDPDSSRPPAYFSRQKSPQCWRLCVRGLVDALDDGRNAGGGSANGCASSTRPSASMRCTWPCTSHSS